MEKLNYSVIETCKGIVQSCEAHILFVNVCEQWRIYLCPYFSLKNRDTRYNSVTDGKDITDIVTAMTSNFAYTRMTSQILEEKTQSIHKECFKFDGEYFLLTNVKENM